jgi:hypothetical protein
MNMVICSRMGAVILVPEDTLEWRVLEEAREIVDIKNVLAGNPNLPVQTYKRSGERA